MNKLKVGGIFTCLALILVLMPVLSANAKEKVYTIKFATAHPPVIPSGIILGELKKIIPERTNGRVKFKPFLGGSLYTDYEAGAQIQAGALEMAFGGYNLSAVSPGWNAIAGLPYIIEDYEHYLRFCKTDAFRVMNANLEAKGIKHLVQAGHPGFANFFNSVRPVKKLEDFKGLKVRVPPIPGLVTMCEIFGIQNVTVDMTEVAIALQTGMVDGTYTPVMKLKSYRLVNIPYATICNTTFIPQTFVVGTKWWNSLPPDLRQILKSIFEEAGQTVNKRFRVMEGKLWKVYDDAEGTHIIKLTKEEKARWIQKSMPIWDKEKQKSEEVRMVIEAIEAVRYK